MIAATARLMDRPPLLEARAAAMCLSDDCVHRTCQWIETGIGNYSVCVTGTTDYLKIRDKLDTPRP